MPFGTLSYSFPLLLLIVYSVFVFLVHTNSDLQIVLRVVRAFLNFLGGLLLVHAYLLDDHSKIALVIKDLFWVITLHALLVIVMYLSPAVRASIYGVAHTGDYVNNTAPFLLGFRIPGLTYGLSQTSVIHLYPLILLPSVLSYGKSWGRFLAMIAGLLNVLAMFVTGRTGLFLGLIILPVFYCVAAWSRIKGASVFRAAGSFLGILVGLALLLLLGGPSIRNIVPEKFSGYSLTHAKEVLEVFDNSSGTRTTNAMSTMFFLPESGKDVLLGSGNFGRGQFSSIESDVGYIRMVFAVGFVGLFFYMAPFLWGIYSSAKVIKYDLVLGVAFILILAISLLLNFKEVSLLTRNQWSIQAVIIGLSCQIQRKKMSSEGRSRTWPLN